MSQKLQKEVSTDWRVVPPARPHCPNSAEGEGALCSSGAMPGGSCAPLTCSSSDISNILGDIQPEVNAASSSSNSHKAFSEVFTASTGSITAEKGYQSLLQKGWYPQESSRGNAADMRGCSNPELDETDTCIPLSLHATINSKKEFSNRNIAQFLLPSYSHFLDF